MIEASIQHPGGIQEPRKHSRSTQKVSRNTQEAPRKHPRGTQEAPRKHPGGPRRHPGAQGASEGIFLINHHHSHAKCKKFPGLVILLCVFDSEVTKHCKLLCKMLTRSANVATERSRALYQHRKNPYSQKLFGEYFIKFGFGAGP